MMFPTWRAIAEKIDGKEVKHEHDIPQSSGGDDGSKGERASDLASNDSNKDEAVLPSRVR